jgi:hypothetical protein
VEQNWREIETKSKRNRREIAAQLIRFRSLKTAELLMNRGKSIRDRSAIETHFLCRYSCIETLSLQITAQSLQITAQTLRSRCVIAAQSLRDRSAIAVQSLRRRCAASAQSL